jgi:hypothetical protein
MELGYLNSNQGYIHLKGYSPYKKDMSKFALSETIASQNSPQNLLRGISLSVSAVLLLLFYLFNMSEKKEQVLQDAS